MAQRISSTNKRVGDTLKTRKQLILGALLPTSFIVITGFFDTCSCFSNPSSSVQLPSMPLSQPLSNLPSGPCCRLDSLLYKNRIHLSELFSSFPPQQDFIEDDEWESYMNVDASETFLGNVPKRFGDSFQNNHSQLEMPRLRRAQEDFEGRMLDGFDDYYGEFDSYLDMDMETVDDETNERKKNRSVYANGSNVNKSKSPTLQRNVATSTSRGAQSPYARVKTRTSNINKVEAESTGNISNFEDQGQSGERQQPPSMMLHSRFKTKPILKGSAEKYGSNNSSKRYKDDSSRSEPLNLKNAKKQRLKRKAEPLQRFRVDPTISRSHTRDMNNTVRLDLQRSAKMSPALTMKKSNPNSQTQPSNDYPETKQNSAPKIKHPTTTNIQHTETDSSKENPPEASFSPPPSSSLPPQPPNYRSRIPPEEILHIKSTINIVDAIESYNLPQFTRSSSYSSHHTAKACCPFHDDSNPSMSIDGKRGLYKCFACGAGGDIFNFIREYDALGKRNGDKKMGYMQAVEFAAKEFGDGRLVEGWGYLGGVERGEYSSGMSTKQIEKLRERERKKER